MDAFQNPFRTQLSAFGERMIAANRQVADWQLAQMKLAEKQLVASIEATRAGWDAGMVASLAMQRTMLDAFLPAENAETKAA